MVSRLGMKRLSYALMGLLLFSLVGAFFLGSKSDTKIGGSVAAEKILDDVYHSEEVFRIDYAEMERKFKIFVYPHPHEEDDMRVGSEAFFFNNIRESSFVTHDPHHAHLFFIPISLQTMHLQVSSYEKVASIAGNYVNKLILKYPYWNRTLGADHFLVTCGDHPHIDVAALFVKNSIRVVCSSACKTDAAAFIPHKDVTLPSVMHPYSKPNDLHNRTILGYWRGVPSSDTRKRLVNLWGADDELEIQDTTAGLGGGTVKKFYNAKFCICPVGSRISNSRVTMAIRYGCVPVILDDYLDLAFNDVLDWGKFSVVVRERDVDRLKGILKEKAGGGAYTRMYRNLLKVRRHLEWNNVAAKYDAFHMVMYELWLRRNVVRY